MPAPADGGRGLAGSVPFNPVSPDDRVLMPVSLPRFRRTHNGREVDRVCRGCGNHRRNQENRCNPVLHPEHVSSQTLSAPRTVCNAYTSFTSTGAGWHTSRVLDIPGHGFGEP